MATTSLTFTFGVLGNITTGLVYLAPVKTFWRIAKNRSTEEFESIPYICKLVNAIFWVYYGLIKPNSILVATVNGFGGLCEIVYIFIFLVCAPPRRRAEAAIAAGLLDVAFPAASISISQFILHGNARISVAGFFCVCFSMATYGSPLSIMKTVITTKSVEYMPFLLSFFLFINGGTWTVYAILTKDLFIGIPNGTGFFLGTTQLILYAMYSGPKSENKGREGDGVQDSLIPASGVVA